MSAHSSWHRCQWSRQVWSSALNTRAANRSEAPAFDALSSSLRSGILAVAVGKFGEKHVPPALFSGLSQELDLAETSAGPVELLFQRASFLGALFMKTRLTISEYSLLAEYVILPRTEPFATGRSRVPGPDTSSYTGTPVTAGHVLATIVGDKDSDDEIYDFALRLLSDERLSREEAYRLGQVLYRDEAPTPTKALIAHVMRVRHETSDELAGLAKAVADMTRANITSLSKSLSRDAHGADGALFKSPPTAILAEPFDGVLTWDLLTPLIARHVQDTYGLRAVMLAGKSSGPKMGPNLRDLGAALGLPSYDVQDDFDTETSQADNNKRAPLGVIADQVDINVALARWVEMRRVIAKRPALATVEKYTDVCIDGATLFVGSAFHPSYIEKMGVAAEAVGFASYVIIGKGVEGTIGLGISDRPCNLLVGWRSDAKDDGGTIKKDGTGNETYARQWIEYRGIGNLCPSTRSEVERQLEQRPPKKGDASCERSAQKIRVFLEQGASGDIVFDARVAITAGALDAALSLICREAPSILQT